jgi:hypothetical protein
MSHNNSGIRTGLTLLGIFFALGVIVAAGLLARSAERVKLADRTIRVKGYAVTQITSDVAEWRLSVSARGANLADTYKKLQADLEKTLAYLASEGIPRENFAIFQVDTTIKYKVTAEGAGTNEIESYVLSQELGVRSSDVQLIRRLSRECTSLIKQGIEITSHYPNYFYKGLEELKVELIGKATKNARLRADQFAANSGSAIGALKSARQGVFQITPVYSTQVSDYGSYDTRTIEKSVKAVVTIEYFVSET